MKKKKHNKDIVKTPVQCSYLGIGRGDQKVLEYRIKVVESSIWTSTIYFHL